MLEGETTAAARTHPSERRDHADKLAHDYHILANTVCRISEVYLYDARLDDALGLLNSDILKDIETELTPRDRVRLQIQRARIMRYKSYLESGSHDAALQILFEAEKTAESLDDQDLLADVLDLIGWVLYAQELWHTSLETPLRYFHRGLELRKEVGDSRGIAESLFHIGLVYQNKVGASDEDMQKAFEYFQEAYGLAEEGHYTSEKGHTARHIAYIYGRRSELDKALSYHKEFLSANEEAGFKVYLSPAHLMVGVAYHAKNELAKALAHFQRARALAEEVGSKRFLAESLIGIGAVEEQSDVGAALAYYQEALTIAQSIGFERGIKIATKRIGTLSDEKER